MLYEVITATRSPSQSQIVTFSKIMPVLTPGSRTTLQVGPDAIMSTLYSKTNKAVVRVHVFLFLPRNGAAVRPEFSSLRPADGRR